MQSKSALAGRAHSASRSQPRPERMASAEQSKKLHILLVPFFATSHIGPFTDLAVRLAAARPGAVEPTVAVTPANVSVVRSALERHGPAAGSLVKIASYPFPAVDGLAPGVENLSAAGADGWRIDAAAMDEALMRPAQEALLREQAPDAVASDIHFFWNSVVAEELGVPCVTFSVIGSFSTLAMRHIGGAVTDGQEVAIPAPGLPTPEIRIPVTELPEFLRGPKAFNPRHAAVRRCFGLAKHTFLDLEQPYCEKLVRNGHVKRAYFVGPLSLPLPPAGAGAGESPCVTSLASKPSCSVHRIDCMDWLDLKPAKSVVYLCFGSLTHVSQAQLRELALGLEASGKPFLWVIRADPWAPPEGWTERVGDRGMVVTGWAPQTAILAHPAVGAFVTHCGWNSVLETIVAGVPVLTWPMFFEQFITERFVTEVLAIGERLSPEGARVRSTRSEENELVPAEAVAQAVTKFMEPGMAGEAARKRVQELSAKAHAAVAEGGSSHRDLHRLIDDLMEARWATAGTTLS
ncbi:hypothetical protein ACP70R_039675 [Stipagrostis hirtigluma subsp. patula]